MVGASEYEIHKAVVDWLAVALPNALVMHIPNNPRSQASGARLKKMGMKAGAADLIIIHHGVIAFVEVKKDKGRLSEAQKVFRDTCAEHQLPYAVIRGVGDLQAFLDDLGIKTRVSG